MKTVKRGRQKGRMLVLATPAAVNKEDAQEH